MKAAAMKNKVAAMKVRNQVVNQCVAYVVMMYWVESETTAGVLSEDAMQDGVEDVPFWSYGISPFLTTNHAPSRFFSTCLLTKVKSSNMND